MPDCGDHPPACRRVVGEAFIKELEKQHVRLLVVSVGPQHLHLQVKLPNHEARQWDILGDCKRVASHAVRTTLPGKIWGRKGRIDTISDREHHEYLFRQYIPDHRYEGAWVWNFRDGVLFDPAAR